MAIENINFLKEKNMSENDETPVADAPESSQNLPTSESESVPAGVQTTEVTPEAPAIQENEAGDVSQPEAPADNALLSAPPVSGVADSSAVSDPKPEQTDNTERPEDGEQDITQDPNDVPSDVPSDEQ